MGDAPQWVADRARVAAARAGRDPAEFLATVLKLHAKTRATLCSADRWTAALEAAVKRKPRVEAPADDPAALFREVVERVRAHYYFEEEWHYTITGLFIFQAWAVRAGALPAVFYVFYGGRFGSGKSNVLYLVSALTDGLLVENVSPSALARSMETGRAVMLDEIDVSRGSELDDIMAALLRSGYRRNGPPYVRWDAKAKKREEIPIFGPKAGTFRSTLDPALQSRGFTIPTGKPIGEGGFDLVLANLWSRTSDLVPRLRAWGKAAAREWSSDRLEQLARSPEFRVELKAIAGEVGANRESELLAIALLVAHMIPADVGPSLLSAKLLREVEVSEEQTEALEEVRDVVLATMSRTVTFAEGGAEVYRVVQRTVRDAISLRRKDRQERPITPSRLALLRREMGVKDVWLRDHHGSLIWNLPKAFVEGLREATTESTPHTVSKTTQNTLSGDTPGNTPHPHLNPSPDGLSTPHPLTDPSLNPSSAVSDVSEGSGGGPVRGGGVDPDPPSQPLREETENWTIPRKDRKREGEP